MQRIRWDSAKQHLRDPACIVHSIPLTFWSWHGTSESLCPSAVLHVTVPKTDFLSNLESLHLIHECCFHYGYFARLQKNVLEQKLSENISAVLIAGGFHLRTIFCACLLPRTDLIHSLYLRSFPQLRIQMRLTLMEAKWWVSPKCTLNPMQQRCFLPLLIRTTQMVPPGTQWNPKFCLHFFPSLAYF